MVLETVSGKAYADLIQDEIFTPLKMLSTRFDDQPGNTRGYTYSPAGMHTPQAFDISWAYAAGGISSTTSDLFRWQQALFAGKVLSPASLAKMMTPYKDGYGFGLVIHTDRDNPFIDHSGQLPGFNSTMAWYPDRRVSVIILENVEPSPPAPSASDVRAALERTLRDQTAGSAPRHTAR
jgi:CubicO group peptidase (beta-lactamase class C family)